MIAKFEVKDITFLKLFFNINTLNVTESYLTTGASDPEVTVVKCNIRDSKIRLN